jgi:hypothetical protein
VGETFSNIAAEDSTMYSKITRRYGCENSRGGTGEFTYETSQKIYTTPFNKENVLAAIEKYPPSEDNDTRGKITYALKREGITNEVGISSLEEFIEGNFDELWARQTTPNPQININSKDLTTFVKLDRESRESHKQYQ